MKTRRLLLIIFLIILAACGGAQETVPESQTEQGQTTDTGIVTETDETTDTAVAEDATQPETEAEAEPGSAAEKTIIQFAVQDWELSRYEDIISVFEEENPTIQIEIVSVNDVLGLDSFGGDWPEDADLRLASAADVLTTFASPQAIEQGLYLDLNPLLEGDAGLNSDDYYPMILEQSQRQGSLWTLPLDMSFHIIFYNKDALDTAGLDYPQPGWTWDDFLALADALTLREDGKVTQWGYVEPYYGGGILQAITGSLYDMDTDPPTVRMNETAVIEAVQWYTDLFLVHEVVPIVESKFEGESMPEGYRLIEEGQAAMWPDVSSSWGYRSLEDNVGIVPYPVSADNQNTSSFFSSSNLSISAGTQHPEAAWAWAKFLSQQPEIIGYDFGFGGPSTLPARRSVAEASGFWTEVDEELGTALAYAIDHAYAPPFVGWGYQPFREGLEAILSEEKTVAEAMADAQIAAEEARDKSLSEAEEVEPVEVVVAAPEIAEVDPNATIITFMMGGVAEMQSYRDLADMYEAAHPGVHIELKQPNFFGDSSVGFADIAADSDCFQWFPNFTEEALTAVLTVDPFLDHYPRRDRP